MDNRFRYPALRSAMVALGVLDIAVGLFLLPFLLLFGYFTFIAGVLYLVFGAALFFKRVYRKLLYYGVAPSTVLHSVYIFIISSNQDASNYFRMTLDNRLGWTLPLVFICLLNIYFATRPGVKVYFK